MSPDTIAPIEHDSWILPIPPSYEQCVATPNYVRDNYQVSPLSMAELFWDDEDD